MKVQRIKVEKKPYPLYILLDNDYKPVETVLDFIKYLDNTGKAPNTIKTYCYHLKHLYEFMDQMGLELNNVHFEELGNFIGWLRNPKSVNIIDLHPKEALREETTVNAILNAVMSYLEYLGRVGKFDTFDVYKEARGRNFKGFLHHIKKGKYNKNVLKVRPKKKKIKTLESSQVKSIVASCKTRRDKLIILLMLSAAISNGGGFWHFRKNDCHEYEGILCDN